MRPPNCPPTRRGDGSCADTRRKSRRWWRRISRPSRASTPREWPRSPSSSRSCSRARSCELGSKVIRRCSITRARSPSSSSTPRFAAQRRHPASMHQLRRHDEPRNSVCARRGAVVGHHRDRGGAGVRGRRAGHRGRGDGCRRSASGAGRIARDAALPSSARRALADGGGVCGSGRGVPAGVLLLDAAGRSRDRHRRDDRFGTPGGGADRMVVRRPPAFASLGGRRRRRCAGWRCWPWLRTTRPVAMG